jgi:hypothetical protein
MKREERRRQALLFEKQTGSSPETEHASPLENKNKNKNKILEHAPGVGCQGSESKAEKTSKKLGCQGAKAEKRTEKRKAESQDEEAAVCVYLFVCNTCILFTHTHTSHSLTHQNIIHTYTHCLLPSRPPGSGSSAVLPPFQRARRCSDSVIHRPLSHGHTVLKLFQVRAGAGLDKNQLFNVTYTGDAKMREYDESRIGRLSSAARSVCNSWWGGMLVRNTSISLKFAL